MSENRVFKRTKSKFAQKTTDRKKSLKFRKNEVDSVTEKPRKIGKRNRKRKESKTVTENRVETPVEVKRETPSKLSLLMRKIEDKLAPFGTDIHRVETPTFSRLLNELSRVAHFKKVEHKEGVLTFYAPRKERREIIAIINNLCYTHTIVGTKGFPYALLSVLKRTGLVVGLFCAVCTFIIYPHFVFKVEYGGNDESVLDVLDAYGIEEGALIFGFDDKAVERALLGLDGVSFASVEKLGTRVYVSVVRELARDEYVGGGAPPTALKDGVVTRVIVFSGTAEVQVGDEVNEGQILIGDYYLKGEDKIPAPANGYVYGERVVTVSRFYPDRIMTESGRTKTKTVIGLFRGSKTPKPPYENYTVKKTVTKNDFLIPFTVYKWTYHEVVEVDFTASDEELKQIAYGEVIDKNQFEKVRSWQAQVERVDGGRLVTLTLTVEERLN